MKKKIIFHDEKWWWFSLFCTRRMKNQSQTSEQRKKNIAFTGVFQEVPLRRYHTHTAQQNGFIIILWMYDFPLIQCSVFTVHPSRNMLSHQLFVCFHVRPQCPVQDCHLPFIDQPHMRHEWMWMCSAVRPVAVKEKRNILTLWFHWKPHTHSLILTILWTGRSAHTLCPFYSNFLLKLHGTTAIRNLKPKAINLCCTTHYCCALMCNFFIRHLFFEIFFVAKNRKWVRKFGHWPQWPRYSFAQTISWTNAFHTVCGRDLFFWLIKQQRAGVRLRSNRIIILIIECVGQHFLFISINSVTVCSSCESCWIISHTRSKTVLELWPLPNALEIIFS